MNHQLWEAAEYNNLQQCRTLLDNSRYKAYTAQVNSKGLNGWTALHVAASKGNVETVRLLLEPRYSADVNARTNSQRTPLHLAAMKGHEEVVDLLLTSGALVNTVDEDGCAAIHYAAGFNHIPVARALLACDCDISLINSINKTAYEMAAGFEMVQLFQAYQQRLALSALPAQAEIPVVRIEEGIGDLQTTHITADTFYADFRPVFLIGKGSFGEVYLVVRVSTQELFALKLLRKDKVLKQKLTRYVLTERRVLSAVNHPFIVKLYYSFQTADRLGMLLEYCPGGDLGYHLSKEKRFAEDRARIYLCECLLAIETLHELHIVYRDLKPDNIVLDTEGHALLTDFGLAKELKASNGTTQSFCGSVAYLAPEVLSRQGHSFSVDYYLLGVLLYEMLVGMPPYFSCVREELFRNIQYSKLKFPLHVSPSARSLINLLLERDPEKRLGSRSISDIKTHAFFQGIDWSAVYRRELRPPVPSPIRRKPDPNATMEVLLGRREGGRQIEKLEDWSFAGQME